MRKLDFNEDFSNIDCSVASVASRCDGNTEFYNEYRFFTIRSLTIMPEQEEKSPSERSFTSVEFYQVERHVFVRSEYKLILSRC